MTGRSRVSPAGWPGDLRTRAEEKARREASPARAPREAPSAEELQRLIHELQVHQVELEMQNEELRRSQSELEVSRARYFDLYDLAPVGYLTLDERGSILEANLTAATLFGVERASSSHSRWHFTSRPRTRKSGAVTPGGCSNPGNGWRGRCG